MNTAGVFAGNEIVQMAIQTEEVGNAFYTAAAQAAKSPQVNELLQWLADQELAHKKAFEAMLQDTPSRRPAEEFAGQKGEYIQALLDSRVLPDPGAGTASLAQMSSDLQAIDFALGFEKDTILFLYEMRDIVPDSQTQRVDALIAEEKSHVKRLSDMKAAMS